MHLTYFSFLSGLVLYFPAPAPFYYSNHHLALFQSAVTPSLLHFQGIFVFLFYIVLNDQVKTYWKTKLCFGESKKSTTASSPTAPAAGKNTNNNANNNTTTTPTMKPDKETENIYENPAAGATEGDDIRPDSQPAHSAAS